MDTFARLAPFIQDYIYRNNWDELKDIQVKACDVIFNTDKNLLLSSGTASGKTEACFLPILSVIYNLPKNKSIDVLYISPLKALINDQFERLEGLLEEADISVFKWHGDVSTSKKKKLIDNPHGILQTTPESLQGLLINRPGQAIALFSKLKYIIIDEMHYFIDNDRGIQLLSVIEQIQRLTNNIPIRVGLSATIGQLDVAKEWLSMGSGRETLAPIAVSDKRKIKIGMHHFYKTKENSSKVTYEFYNHLFELTENKKCIIYDASRNGVEQKIINLKKMAAKRHAPDIYYAHHGSLSMQLREETERQMKSSNEAIVVGATSTLELGIDVGSLDRIIQIGTPSTSSSFVQKLGRTGRRGNTGEMYFMHVFDEAEKGKGIENQYDFDFLKSIAIVLLYVQEKWIEPIEHAKHNYGMLYHQTMCCLKYKVEMYPKELAQYMLTLAVFKAIDIADYKLMLQHMVEVGHLEYTEEGKLIIGLKAEPMVNHYSFLAVFESSLAFTVKSSSTTIGTVDSLVPVGGFLVLGGKPWTVVAINEKTKTIFVNASSGNAASPWSGIPLEKIDGVIVRKMREILMDDSSYPFLSKSALNYLNEMREDIRIMGILDNKISQESPNSYEIFPWLGTKEQITLSYILKANGIINKTNLWSIEIPYTNIGMEGIAEIIRKVEDTDVRFEDIEVDKAHLKYVDGKFNAMIPQSLTEKQFRLDYLDLQLLKRVINPD